MVDFVVQSTLVRYGRVIEEAGAGLAYAPKGFPGVSVCVSTFDAIGEKAEELVPVVIFWIGVALGLNLWVGFTYRVLKRFAS